MLKLKFAVINDSDQELVLRSAYIGSTRHDREWPSVSGVTLIDDAAKKKYFVVRDTEDTPICSMDIENLKPHDRGQYWIQFPAPPANVQAISVVIPHFEPMTKVPLSQ